MRWRNTFILIGGCSFHINSAGEEANSGKGIVVRALASVSAENPYQLESGTVVKGLLYEYSLLRKIDPYLLWDEDSFGKPDRESPQALHYFESWPLVVSSQSMSLMESHALEYETAWQKCIRDKQRKKTFSAGGLGEPTYTGFEKYNLGNKFDVGGQGEVWEAVRLKRRDRKGSGSSSFSSRVEKDELYVLKRVFGEKGDQYFKSGLREAVFGERLRGSRHISRFVESFNRTIPQPNVAAMGEEREEIEEMWLVFRYEGRSLDSLLYSKVDVEGSIFLEPSALWKRLRRDFEGSLVRREILRQILEGLCTIQRAHIAHRDIKPKNILIKEWDPSEEEDDNDNDDKNREQQEEEEVVDPEHMHKEKGQHKNKRKRARSQAADFRVRIADFGSAYDTKDSLLNAWLYGPEGPTSEEETAFYRPPEALLGGVTSLRFPYLGNDRNGLEPLSNKLPLHAFDMWSVGVVALEMLLGTAEIFEVDSRSRAKIDLEIERTKYLFLDEEAKEAVRAARYRLRALEIFGITPEGVDKARFNQTLVNRDPFGRGFYFSPSDDERGQYRDPGELRIYGDNELDFIVCLLSYSPWERLTAKQALEHPYFLLDFN